MTRITRIAPDVGWLPISFVNVYFVGHSGGPWVLVDTGIPGSANQIIAAAAGRFGGGSRPEAIVLTHGHFDHAGSAQRLAEYWNVPIYAHALEAPYLTGCSSYPPPDPTTGGAIGFLSRFMPSGPYDFGTRLRLLEEGKVPGLADWEWLPTPGHTPGHISLFRRSDRALIAGDAFATMDMESWTGLTLRKQVLARAGAPFNTDWAATEKSVRLLASLEPTVAACGHGIPIEDADFPMHLRQFANRFEAPRGGRYVREPAIADASGVKSLPPPVFDPVPIATAAGMFAIGLVLGAGWLEDDAR